MNGTEYEDNLEVIVRDSLGCFTPLSADQIDTVSNASKYSISENDRDAVFVARTTLKCRKRRHAVSAGTAG